MKITQETLFTTTQDMLDSINDGEYPEVYEYLDRPFCATCILVNVIKS